MNEFGIAVSALFTSLIGLAIVAVIVSKQSQTPQVFQAASQGLGYIIGQAVSPVTGATNQSGVNSGYNVAGVGGALQ